MPDPHTESGSQDIIIIPAQESMVSLHDVTALRFILRQPSPNWKTFNVEEIAVIIFLNSVPSAVAYEKVEADSIYNYILVQKLM